MNSRIAFCGGCALFFAPTAFAQQRNKPNILVIMAAETLKQLKELQGLAIPNN
jgi:hypothetical protein